MSFASESLKRQGSGLTMNFPFLLTLLFIGLQLTEQIDWSWWWVLSPLYIPFGVVLILLIVVAATQGILNAIKKDEIK